MYPNVDLVTSPRGQNELVHPRDPKCPGFRNLLRDVAFDALKHDSDGR